MNRKKMTLFNYVNGVFLLLLVIGVHSAHPARYRAFAFGTH